MANNELDIADEDGITIRITDQKEAQILLDCLNGMIKKGNKNPVLVDLVKQLDSEFRLWKVNDILDTIE